MAIYNSRSAEEIIGKLYRDLNLDDPYVERDMIEWTFEALELIGSHNQYEKALIFLPVSSYTATTPEDLVLLNGTWEVINPQKDDSGNYITSNIEMNDLYKLARSGETRGNFYFEKSDLNKGLSKSDLGRQTSNDGHLVNPNSIHVYFEEGLILIHGLTIKTDEEGYPLVPDDQAFREAIEWFIMKKLILGQKWNHPEINYNYANQQWHHYCQHARSQGDMPDPDEMNNLMDTVLQMADTRYYGNSGYEYGYKDSDNYDKSKYS